MEESARRVRSKKKWLEVVIGDMSDCGVDDEKVNDKEICEGKN